MMCLECQNPKKCDLCDEDKKADSVEAQPACMAFDVLSSKEVTDEGSSGVESTENCPIHLDDKACQVGSEDNTMEDAKFSVSNEHIPQVVSPSGDAAGVSGDLSLLTSSLILNPCKESATVTEESYVCPAVGMATTGTSSSPFGRVESIDDQPDISQKTASKDSKEIEKKEPVSCMSTQREAFVVSSSSGLSSCSMHASKSVKEFVEPDNLDSKDSAVKEFATLHNLETKKCESSTTRNSEPLQTSDTVECGLPLDKSNGITENGKSCLKREKRLHSRTRYSSLKPTTRSSTTSEIDHRNSEIGLDHGDDALEVAVLVAIEAKREVADREQCSSSPVESSEGEIIDSSSDELEEEKCVQANLSKSPVKSGHSSDGTSLNENNSTGSENLDVDRNRDQVQEVESPKSNSVIQESAGYIEKTKCSFDLNVDICNNDADDLQMPALNHQNNLSAPIATVATSKGAPAMALATLNFEGEQGWKGSATSSAFRPASPRRIPDSEKMAPTQCQKSNFMEIDLNLVKSVDDIAVDPALEKQILVSPKMPSGDCSMEVSSRKAERMNLDLNSLGDDDTFPDLSYSWRQHHRNGKHSTVPTSSSSRQPSMRDFDLNNNPFFLDAKSSTKEEMTFRSYKIDDPITPVCSRMTTEKKEHVSQMHQLSAVNGLSMESSVGARPSLAYSHTPTPGFGYNVIAPGPPASSLVPALYTTETFPYVVDSRGSTIMPHVFGSTAGTNGHPSYRPPFLVSVADGRSGLGTVGSFQPGLDLNSGALSMEIGSRDLGNFRQFFVKGQGCITEEQMRVASQSATGSNLPLKRKDPDCEQESHPFNCKQVTSWH